MRFSRITYITVCSTVTALVAMIVILGWYFNSSIMKSMVPGAITMKANTAVIFFGFAVTHWILARYRRSSWSFVFAAMFSVMASVISGLTLIEYFYHLNFGIDEFLFKDPESIIHKSPPGRLAPITAVCFILMSGSLILASNPWKKFHKVSQFINICVGLVAFQGFVGYFCGITSTFGFSFYTQMAIHTTLLFLLTSVTNTLLHSKTGFVAVLRSRSMSGSMARRLILAAAILPPVMTWFENLCEKSGWLDDNGSVLVRTTGIAALLIVIVWKTATELHDSEQKRFASETDITARKKAEKESKLHNQHLAAIIATQYEIATAGMNLERVVNLAVSRATTLLHADGAIVEMLSGDELHYRAASGHGVQFLGLRLKVDSSFSGRCVREKKLLKCDDTESDPRVDVEACRKVGVGSMIVAPLLNEDEVIGVFKAYSSSKHAFSESHVNTLQLVVGLVSAAMSRARSFAEKQKAQDEAQRAAQAKAEFLANMSHEIRTPLNGIIGIADLLSEMPLGPQQKKYSDIIRSSGQGLLTIVNDILDFSKIEAGKMDLELIEFDLGTLVESQVGLFSSVAREKGLTVSTEIDSSLNGHFRGDSGRIGQILLNLIGNAIKFTSSGSISVRAMPETIAENGTQTIRFEIADTGVGIPNEVIHRLFKPFTQADGSTARKFGGTGLGLSISKRLAEMMGGQIGVESQLGKGSIFWFTVQLSVLEREVCPINKVQMAEKVIEAIQESSDRARFKVLVAEDNPVNQMVALAQLKALGYSAQAVANGKEAVDAYMTGQFHLILMDCQMPEMDGFEATQKIREFEAKGVKRIPIIALTANALKEDEEKCVQFGMDSFISKPVKREQLLEKLEQYLSVSKERAA